MDGSREGRGVALAERAELARCAGLLGLAAFALTGFAAAFELLASQDAQLIPARLVLLAGAGVALIGAGACAVCGALARDAASATRRRQTARLFLRGAAIALPFALLGAGAFAVATARPWGMACLSTALLIAIGLQLLPLFRWAMRRLTDPV